MFNVLVTPRSFGKGNDAPIRFLENNGCTIIRETPAKPQESAGLIPFIKGIDGVIAGLEIYDAAIIDAADRLKVISRYGVGYNNVDLDAAGKKGITVAYTPGTNEHSVADLSITLMLTLARRIPAIAAELKSGSGNRPMGLEMWNKTLGIIGLGRIGKGVAKRAKGFNMRLLCVEAYPDKEFAEQYGVEYCGLDKLLAESDYISVNAPLTPETKGLINSASFVAMKKTAIIVNTARGGIIDESALYDALAEGKIYAAGLDVTEVEPASDSPLLKLDNCIVTSHIGGYTADAVNNMGMMAAENLVKILNGEKCEYIVPGLSK